MAAWFRRLSVCFGAGVVGGLANALFVWGSGVFGLSAVMGVAIAPAWTPAWLYQRLVWGGIWGLLFLPPVLERSVIIRGALMGLGPSAVQLLIVFPQMLGKGMFGLALGEWTPLFVLLANAVWGIAAALWMRLALEPQGRSSRMRL